MNRLNLGCGKDYKEGYINIDVRRDIKADLYIDLSVFPYPFDDSSIDKIYAIDVLEHISYWKQDMLFAEFSRILKSGGRLLIRCPDLDFIYHYYHSEDGEKSTTLEHRHDEMMHYIFGGQDYPENTHLTSYTKALMEYKLKKYGFKIIELKEGIGMYVEAKRS